MFSVVDYKDLSFTYNGWTYRGSDSPLPKSNEPLVYPHIQQVIDKNPVIDENFVQLLGSFVPVKCSNKLTQYEHTQTEKLLKKADKVAKSLLKKKDQTQSSTRCLHSSQLDRSQGIGRTGSTFIFMDNRSYNTVYFQSRGNEAQQEEDQKKRDLAKRGLVGLVGGVILTVSLVFMWKSLSASFKARKDVVKFDELNKSWIKSKELYQANPEYQTHVDRVAHDLNSILRRRKTNKIQQVVLSIFGLMAGGLGIAGAFSGQSPLMVTGMGMGAIVGVGSLYQIARACLSQRDQREAEEIQASLEALNRMSKQVECN